MSEMLARTVNENLSRSTAREPRPRTDSEIHSLKKAKVKFKSIFTNSNSIPYPQINCLLFDENTMKSKPTLLQVNALLLFLNEVGAPTKTWLAKSCTSARLRKSNAASLLQAHPPACGPPGSNAQAINALVGQGPRTSGGCPGLNLGCCVASTSLCQFPHFQKRGG